VRWQHPTHGLLFPDSFIAMAEAGPLIGPLTEALVEIGLTQMQTWQAAGYTPQLGIKLSPSMLSDVTLPDRFAAMAARLGVPTEAIVFEITETGVAREELIYLEIVTRLRMKGFRLSVDDFGTGFSSLASLKRLPIDALKIDQSFVRDATSDPDDAALVMAIITLAHNLRLTVIAEGVETEDQLRFLQLLRCDEIQGYFFSKPLPADTLATIFDSYGEVSRKGTK
jgi:EAL domain-containing protein (putative c-di-GMP-specific phosphodiesterase class I)